MAAHSCCNHSASVASVHQTLDEMDFERGLWSAAVDGDMDRLRHLLRETDANAVDSSGYTALHYAARNGHMEACRLLLDHRACVNCQTRTGGSTALMRASYCGHKDVVHLLLDRQADVTIKDSDGKTALHKACEKGSVAVVEILLKKDSSLLWKADNRGQTPASFSSSDNAQLSKIIENFLT